MQLFGCIIELLGRLFDIMRSMAEFLASQQQISVVESAVEHAYTVVSRNKGLDPIDVAIGGYCSDITDAVLARLSGTFSVRRLV